jgi:hypothetical protein
MMKDLRVWLGKTGNKHSMALLERCALTLVDRKNNRSLGCTNKHKGDQELEEGDVGIDAIFCEVFVFVVDCNLFGKGPPKHFKNRSSSTKRGISREFTNNEDGFSTICDANEKLNKEIISIFSIGESRLKRYYNAFTKNGKHLETYRSEDERHGGVSLRSIKPLVRESKEFWISQVKRSVTVKQKDIDRWYNRFDLKMELEELIKYYKETIDNNLDDNFNPGDTKESNIPKLIMLRNMIKSHVPNWSTRRMKEIEEKMEEERGAHDLDIEVMIARELNTKLFRLPAHDRYDQIHTLKRLTNSEQNDVITNDTIEFGSDDDDHNMSDGNVDRRKSNGVGMGRFGFVCI